MKSFHFSPHLIDRVLNILIKTKKTLYGILEVNANASLDEIRSAYARLTKSLEQKQKIIGVDEAEIQKKAIEMAYDTLSNPASRDSYDAKYANAEPASAASFNMVPKVDVNVAIDDGKQSPLKKVLMLIAGVMVAWLLMQLVYMFIFYRASHSAGDARNQFEEQMKIQEYYLEYGVRPASGAEVDRLLAEAREKRAESQEKKAAERQAEREKRDQERKYQQWLNDGQRISSQLDRDRENAEKKAQREMRKDFEREQRIQEQRAIEEKNRERQRINNERRSYGLPSEPY